jgi:hypothetical protein
MSRRRRDIGAIDTQYYRVDVEAQGLLELPTDFLMLQQQQKDLRFGR